ncbi:baseplate J/gp47 family protein [Hymenobacter elongatus]|uniref:Uncharacterized protein n=1 Tax=Hymenobacter elongatus TaxID=877208 RepID=A0A4Z0PFV5_9BACT|nr:baseplate J/gp47 family protein [Hymenobacter elongatus]TGE14007.1 hypothetical protein E5J99_17970 [Hymenobacter elongatus]
MTQPSTPSFQDSGTSQQGRRQPDLLDSPVQLADYSTEELLAYVAHFSKLVRYYEVVEGRVESLKTWNLAEKRSLLIIALIATQRLTAQYEHYAHLARQLHDPMATAQQHQQAQQKILGRIYKMAEQFDNWCVAHQRSHLRRTFQAELTAAAESLTKPLQHAAQVEQALMQYHGLPPRPARERRPEQLLHLWQPLAPGMRPVLPEDLAPLETQLVDLLWEFHKAQASLAALAHRVLVHGLRGADAQEHDVLPEMALLITFMELYQHAQSALNTIPRRHLNYYYQQVLRVGFRPAQPDHAFLSFALAKGVTTYVLPAGTEVEGGKDATGNRFVFSTTQDQLLTPWRVQQLSSVFVSGHGSKAVKGIYVAPQANSADGLGRPLPPAQGWAPFGEDQDLISPTYRTMTDAAVGFAVSAAVLELQEGRRTIELSLRCEPASFQRFAAILTQAGQPLQRVFDTMGLAAFRVEVTGAEGWLPLRVREVCLEPASATLTWHLTLDRDQPAVVPHQPALHAGRFQSAWPVLRLRLNERAPEYAYSSFSVLQPQIIGVRVRAQDVQGVQLANQLGPLAPGLPFAPFGNQARPGDYLLVGLPELFRKRLTELILTLDWASLPTDPGGFADHYQGYDPPVENDSFRVTASYRRDWRWVPTATPVASVGLFQTIPDPTRRSGTALLPTSHLALPTTGTADFRQQPVAPVATMHTEAATGAIRLELVAPTNGFGTDQYPTLLVETLQYNARNPARPRPLPRPPFVPMVKSLWLSYVAAEEIEVSALFGPATADRPHFYHIHPLADYQPARLVARPAPPPPTSSAAPDKAVAPKPQPGYRLRLLPEFSAEGTLYIGLTQLALPQAIDLLFELAPANRLPRQAEMTRSGHQSQPPAMRWSYLTQDEWRPFAPGTTLRDDVVHDQSHDLTELRPVRLSLPTTLSTQHTSMPEGLYWLRATVEHGADLIGRVLAVHTHVVRAVRVGPAPEQPMTFGANLPAHSLGRLVKSRPELARVAQPLASFDGRAAESQDAYNTRVSERLRHRGRAVTPWDYEHLVLDQFPEVCRVKCLRASQLPPALRKPGLVVVVVMPYQPAAVPTGYRLPTFSPGRLARIRAMLRQAASAHVQLEVCNPLYEVIQVRGGVCFTATARRSHPKPGALMEQLQHELSEFLSPWNDQNTARQGLHYSLTSSMVLSFLNQLPYVEFVTAFSVVKMALEDNHYLFYDTEALATDTQPAAADDQIQPLEDATNRPWSVYVSAGHHQLEEVEALSATEPVPAAQATGIGRLAVGSDFVIHRSFEAPSHDQPARYLTD